MAQPHEPVPLPKKFSEQLEALLQHDRLTLEQVLEQTRTASFGFVLCLVALPSALPVPAPGLSVPFGVMIIFLAGQLLLGRKTLWVPDRWQQKAFSLKGFKPHLKRIVKFVRLFEWFIRPRLSFIYLLGTPLLALIMLLGGAAMFIPIPGTNTIPALGVFLMSLGMIEKDGLAALAGIGATLLGVFLTVSILWFGGQGVAWVWQVVGL